MELLHHILKDSHQFIN